MRTIVSFQNVVKHGFSPLKINDLSIFERENVAFYGLSRDHMENLVNQMSGAYLPDEGAIRILGVDSRDIAEEEKWFEYVRKLAIYSSQAVFQELASIGENVATLCRLRDESLEEPQLSASVLHLANRVGLTITDLSKMMSEATPVLRMKVRLARSLSFQPKVLILCEPGLEESRDVMETFVDLLKRAKRKLGFTIVLFTSDFYLLQNIADRVIFLNPRDGYYIENQLRGWYHKLFPFLDPSPDRLLQLSRDILQYGNVTIRTSERITKH